MTPDQARALLDGTTPGPWEWADREYDDDRTAHPDHHDGPQWGDIAWH